MSQMHATDRQGFLQAFDRAAAQLSEKSPLSLIDLRDSLGLSVKTERHGSRWLALLTAPVQVDTPVRDERGQEIRGVVKGLPTGIGRSESEARYILAKEISGKELVFLAGFACERSFRLPEVVDTEMNYGELAPQSISSLVKSALVHPQTGEKLSRAIYQGSEGRIRVTKEDTEDSFNIFIKNVFTGDVWQFTAEGNKYFPKSISWEELAMMETIQPRNFVGGRLATD